MLPPWEQERSRTESCRGGSCHPLACGQVPIARRCSLNAVRHPLPVVRLSSLTARCPMIVAHNLLLVGRRSLGAAERPADVLPPLLGRRSLVKVVAVSTVGLFGPRECLPASGHAFRGSSLGARRSLNAARWHDSCSFAARHTTSCGFLVAEYRTQHDMCLSGSCSLRAGAPKESRKQRGAGPELVVHPREDRRVLHRAVDGAILFGRSSCPWRTDTPWNFVSVSYGRSWRTTGRWRRRPRPSTSASARSASG